MGCNSYVVFVAFSINNNTFNLELICFLVNWLKGWCGVLFLRLGLLGLIVYLSRIDTANVTTGRLILKEWHWHFFIAMVEPPSVCTKAGGGVFLSTSLLNLKHRRRKAVSLLWRLFLEIYGSTPSQFSLCCQAECFVSWETVCDVFNVNLGELTRFLRNDTPLVLFVSLAGCSHFR